MFKASIGLVVLAFITLAYGWIRGIDILLYGSIAFSALAGVALLRSTLMERRKHPELTRRRRRRNFEDTGEQKVVLGERERKSLAELRMELSGLKGEVEGREELYGAPKRTPLRPFSEPPDEFDEAPHERRPRPAAQSDERRPRPAAQSDERRPRPAAQSDERRPRQSPAQSDEQRVRQSPAQADDFRSRLSAVLGETAAPSRPEDTEPPYREGRPSRPRAQQPRPEPEFDDDEIGSDWIRIEDVPRISRATQQGGGYARPDLPPVQPPKRRTPAAGARKTAPARPEAGTPARRRTAGAKDAPAKPAAPRGSASKGSPSDPPQPRTRPKPQA